MFKQRVAFGRNAIIHYFRRSNCSMVKFGLRSVAGKAIILMYHHVNLTETDTWQLSVSPDNFRRQLEVLRNWNVISLAELTKAIQLKSIKPRSIVISFDDGYKDNFSYAAPLLETFDFPATFFLTNFINDNGDNYWWDLLESTILKSKSFPSNISLQLGSQKIEFNAEKPWTDFLKKDQLEALQNWLPWKIPPQARDAFFVYLCEAFKKFSPIEKQIALQQLAQQCGAMYAGEENEIMSIEESKQLANRKGFEIGGHTADHTALAGLSKQAQWENINRNTIDLSNRVAKRLQFFAYPHGSFDAASIRVLKSLDYAAACTTNEATVNSKTDLYRLPRFHVKNWNGEEFRKRLENWIAE